MAAHRFRSRPILCVWGYVCSLGLPNSFIQASSDTLRPREARCQQPSQIIWHIDHLPTQTECSHAGATEGTRALRNQIWKIVSNVCPANASKCASGRFDLQHSSMVKIIRNTRYVVRKFNGDATIELFARSEAGPKLHSEKGSEKGNAKAAKAGIRIDGVINGTIKSKSTIFCGDSAVIEGKISAHSLVSSGKIKGLVSAEDTIKINRSGSIGACIEE